MTARQQWAVVGVIAVLFAGGLWGLTHTMKDELFPVGVGTKAPDFSAQPLLEPVYPRGADTAFGRRTATSAAPHTLASYRGDVVLLNIWATWCAPCRAEMPSLERLHRELGPRGLKIVAVSIDNEGYQRMITDFAARLDLTFEILHDPPGAIKQQYRTTGVPETFVLGRDGTIRKKVVGATDWSSEGNRALIAQLLSEERPR